MGKTAGQSADPSRVVVSLIFPAQHFSFTQLLKVRQTQIDVEDNSMEQRIEKTVLPPFLLHLLPISACVSLSLSFSDVTLTTVIFLCAYHMPTQCKVRKLVFEK